MNAFPPGRSLYLYHLWPVCISAFYGLGLGSESGRSWMVSWLFWCNKQNKSHLSASINEKCDEKSSFTHIISKTFDFNSACDCHLAFYFSDSFLQTLVAFYNRQTGSSRDHSETRFTPERWQEKIFIWTFSIIAFHEKSQINLQSNSNHFILLSNKFHDHKTIVLHFNKNCSITNCSRTTNGNVLLVFANF